MDDNFRQRLIQQGLAMRPTTLEQLLRSMFDWVVIETDAPKAQGWHKIVYVITQHEVPADQRAEAYKRIWEYRPVGTKVELVFCHEYERGEYNGPW